MSRLPRVGRKRVALRRAILLKGITVAMSDRSSQSPLESGMKSSPFVHGVSAGSSCGVAPGADGSAVAPPAWDPEWDERRMREEKERRAARVSAELNATAPHEAPASRPELHSGQALASDEIDLRDLIKFVWGLRVYLVVGAALGAAAGFILPGTFVPLKYRSQFPIRIDVKSLPAIADPKALVETLNSSIATSKADEIFFNSFAAAFPFFAERYGSAQSGSLSSAADESAAAEPERAIGVPPSPFQAALSKNTKDMPVRVEGSLSSEQFVASVELPFQTFDEAKLSSVVVSALNAIITDHNKRASEIYAIQNNAELEDKKLTQENALAALKAGGRTSREELQRVAIEIHRFSYRFFSLTSSLPDAARTLINRSDRPDQDDASDIYSLRTPSRIVYEKAAGNLAQSVTVVSLLAETGQLGADQVNNFHESYQSLQFELSRAFAEVQTQQEMTSRAAQELAATVKASLTPISREKSFLPLFESTRPADGRAPQAGRAVESAGAEKPSPSPRMLFAAFTLLGMLATGFLGAAATFVRRTDWS